MRCITVTQWICDKCGYITTYKPHDDDSCPACSGQVTYSSNTKGGVEK